MTRLRAVRESAGLSQDEMARRIGISDSLLRQLETGRTTPTPRVAQILKQTLGESADRLLQPVDLGRLPKVPAARV
ncbi:MAG: Helix-turn-helix domain [Candidatus Eremiobacteraeota bacterium]|nr:Helix-turn-helix domain [Candidatus Eremiobacteraeota bacterium]